MTVIRWAVVIAAALYALVYGTAVTVRAMGRRHRDSEGKGKP